MHFPRHDCQFNRAGQFYASFFIRYMHELTCMCIYTHVQIVNLVIYDRCGCGLLYNDVNDSVLADMTFKSITASFLKLKPFLEYCKTLHSTPGKIISV